jgi:hypothetical protein
MNPHAILRMEQRGITAAMVDAAMSREGFAYYHKGMWKVGFYDPNTGVFVGTTGRTILTVIDDLNPNYIRNLKEARP